MLMIAGTAHSKFEDNLQSGADCYLRDVQPFSREELTVILTSSDSPLYVPELKPEHSQVLRAIYEATGGLPRDVVTLGSQLREYKTFQEWGFCIERFTNDQATKYDNNLVREETRQPGLQKAFVKQLERLFLNPQSDGRMKLPLSITATGMTTLQSNKHNNIAYIPSSKTFPVFDYVIDVQDPPPGMEKQTIFVQAKYPNAANYLSLPAKPEEDLQHIYGSTLGVALKPFTAKNNLNTIQLIMDAIRGVPGHSTEINNGIFQVLDPQKNVCQVRFVFGSAATLTDIRTRLKALHSKGRLANVRNVWIYGREESIKLGIRF